MDNFFAELQKEIEKLIKWKFIESKYVFFFLLQKIN